MFGSDPFLIISELKLKLGNPFPLHAIRKKNLKNYVGVKLGVNVERPNYFLHYFFGLFRTHLGNT